MLGGLLYLLTINDTGYGIFFLFSDFNEGDSE